MLRWLDQRLRGWHVAALSAAAIAWFIAMMWVSYQVVPKIAFFRCPIGFCVTGYSAQNVTVMLQAMGKEGRDFLQGTLLAWDRVLPFLVMTACLAHYVWWTRPGDRYSMSIEPKYRYMLLAVPILYGIADYCENWAFGEVLRNYPNIRYGTVSFASRSTALKSQLVVAALGIVAALAIAAWIEGRTTRAAGDRG